MIRTKIRELFLLFIFLVYSSLQSSVILDKVGSAPKVIQISLNRLLVFSTKRSFIYDIKERNAQNLIDHSDISGNDMYNSAGAYNNNLILIVVKNKIFAFDSIGNQKKLLNIETTQPNNIQDMNSVFTLPNGNFLVTTVFYDVSNRILHLIYDGDSIIQRNLIQLVDSNGQNFAGGVQGAIDCHPYNDEYFICFYLSKGISDRCLIAGFFKIVDLELVEYFQTSANEISVLNSVKKGNLYAIIGMDSTGKPFSFLFNALKKKFEKEKTQIFITNKTFANKKSQFSLAIGINNIFTFVCLQSSIASLLHFDDDFTLKGQVQEFTLESSYNLAAEYVNANNQFETMVTDMSSGGVLMYYFDSNACVDICVKDTLGQGTIDIPFPSNLISGFRFPSLSSQNGVLESKDSTETLNTYTTYYPEILKLVYKVQNQVVSDELKYFTVLNDYSANPISTCKISILFDKNSFCPCESSDPTKILYHFEDQCLEVCPFYTILNITDETCYSCAKANKYLYQDQCIESQDIPETSFVSDTTYNIVKDCQSPCKKCKDTENNCLSCIDGYTISKTICVKDSNTGTGGTGTGGTGTGGTGTGSTGTGGTGTGGTSTGGTEDKIIFIETDYSLEDFNQTLDKDLGKYTNKTTIIKGNGYNIEITNSSLTDGNFDLSKIDFSECEKILRKSYQISQNEKLIYVKVDIDKGEGALTDEVEYSIFDSEGRRLDLSLCKDAKIKITYTIKDPSKLNKTLAESYLKKGIDIYDSESPFFNDICYSFKSDGETDITLEDRRTDIFQNESFCDSGCTYDKMFLENNSISCDCTVKPVLSSKIDFNFFYSGLKSVIEYANFKVVLCYNLVFDTHIMIHNYGFWLFLCFITIHIPLAIFYFVKGVDPIRRYLTLPHSPPKMGKRHLDYFEEIISNNTPEDENHERTPQVTFKQRNNLVKEEDTKNIWNNSREKKQSRDRKKDNEYYEDEKGIRNTENSQEEFTKKTSNYNSHKVIQSYIILRKKGKSKEYCLSNNSKPLKSKKIEIDSSTQDGISIYSSNKSLSKKKFQNKQKKTNSMNNLTSEEGLAVTLSQRNKNNRVPSRDYLDDFVFEEAIIYDDRTFWFSYYLCLLTKQGILESFVLKSPFELKVMRIITFIFSNSLDFALNALFYLDSMISNRYHFEGNLGFLFDLENTILTNLISCAVGFILMKILDCLSNSKDKLEKLSKEGKRIPLETERKVLRCLRIKLSFFLFFEFVLMIFFWYYVSAFCAVYRNTQLSWLQSGFTSFLIGNIIPFGVALGIAILRYIALKNRMPKLFSFSIWLYKL